MVRCAPGRLELTIESWARSSDRVLDALYDTLGFARTLQSEMWVVACERFAEPVGGRAIGPVEVTTSATDDVATAPWLAPDQRLQTALEWEHVRHGKRASCA